MANMGLLSALHRRNLNRGGVILVFHEIKQQILETHLAYLAELYTFVSLDEMVKRLRENRPTAGLATVTFDDGVGETTEDAAALAMARGWPMTFYLPTHYLDTGEPCWFLELEALLKWATGQTLSVGGRTFSLNGPASVETVLRALRGVFMAQSSEKGVEGLMCEIRLSLSGSKQRPSGLRLPAPISWNRVQQLAMRPELSFEAHTVNHLAVSRITEQKLVRELEDSRRRIEEITGRRVEHFCYPYGSPDEVGEFAPSVVRRLFQSGTTTSRGRCKPGSDLALLPRVPIDGGDSREVASLKVGVIR